VATAVVIVLNVILLLQTLGVPLDVFPGS
jgi:hypothetical protein